MASSKQTLLRADLEVGKVEWEGKMLVKKLENATCLSHFNTEQISALLKLILMFYLALIEIILSSPLRTVCNTYCYAHAFE